MSEKACKNCKLVFNGDVCPLCQGTDLSNEWTGTITILDPTESEVAKKLKIAVPGKYAVRVS